MIEYKGYTGVFESDPSDVFVDRQNCVSGVGPPSEDPIGFMCTGAA